MIRPREMVRLAEPTYKIGKSKQPEKRLPNYGKGSELIITLAVEDCDKVEQAIKVRFADRFTQERLYGLEYFSGVCKDMVAEFLVVVYECQGKAMPHTCPTRTVGTQTDPPPAPPKMVEASTQTSRVSGATLMDALADQLGARDHDLLREWITERCEADRGYTMRAKEALEDFNMFTDCNMTAVAFSKLLISNGYTRKKTMTNNSYEGLRLRLRTGNDMVDDV